MATETFITKKEAVMYNANGKPRERIPVGTIIVCDWLWPDGPLAGMRKIVSGYPTDGDRFIKDIDIQTYVPPPPPTEGPADFYISAGSLLHLEDVDGTPLGTYMVTERAKAVKQ